ncbi:MAG: mevalonate kinase family protein [Rhodanobacteraceae bacterium]
MRVDASAPGKLVLLGEYAVLEGAPALVLAVNRRAHVSLTDTAGDACEIVSPTFGLRARLRMQQDGGVRLDPQPAELEWVATLLAQFARAQRLPPCRIELDSNAFHLDHAGSRVKLGLGSSAALAVALLGALHASAKVSPPTLDEGIRAHRAIQQGRGSGVDVAASLTGASMRFQLHGASADVVAASLPRNLHWRCVYSGRPASTRAMLATVAAWREREPVAFTRRMHELTTISAQGIDAADASDTVGFLSALQDYAHALARFGEAAGVDIVSQEHRTIAAIAASCGCAYKSCGAGGGDTGITFAVDDTRLQEFAGRAARAGFPVIELETDPRGLDVASSV